MTLKTFIFSLILLPLFAFGQEVNQQTSALASEGEYFAAVNETGGYINKSLHESFWQMMGTKYDESQRGKIVSDLQNALDLLKAFQTKVWESAKESYYFKMVHWVPGYEQEKEKLLKLESPYFLPKTIVADSENIVKASAERTPVDLGRGKFYITPELIDENLIGMKGSYERLKILLTPEWKEEYKEYVLPKVQISLLSLYAPDEYEESVKHVDERLIIHIAQLSDAQNSIYEIGSIDYRKGDKKFSDFDPQEKEIYIQEFVKEQFAGYKVSAPLFTNGQWRGYEFSKGVSSDQGYHIIVMSMFVGDKALYLKHVTNTHLSQASNDFNEFIKRIQILEK